MEVKEGSERRLVWEEEVEKSDGVGLFVGL